MHNHASAHFISRLLMAVAILGLIVCAIFLGDRGASKDVDPPAIQSPSPQKSHDEEAGKSAAILVNRSLRLTSWSVRG